MKNLNLIGLVVIVVVLVNGVVYAAPPVSAVAKQMDIYRVFIPEDIGGADISIPEEMYDGDEWYGTRVVYYKKFYVPTVNGLHSELSASGKYESRIGRRDMHIETTQDGFVWIAIGEEVRDANGDLQTYTNDWAGKPAYIIIWEFGPVPPKPIVRPILNKASNKK